MNEYDFFSVIFWAFFLNLDGVRRDESEERKKKCKQVDQMWPWRTQKNNFLLNAHSHTHIHIFWSLLLLILLFFLQNSKMFLVGIYCAWKSEGVLVLASHFYSYDRYSYMYIFYYHGYDIYYTYTLVIWWYNVRAHAHTLLLIGRNLYIIHVVECGMHAINRFLISLTIPRMLCCFECFVFDFYWLCLGCISVSCDSYRIHHTVYILCACIIFRGKARGWLWLPQCLLA